MYFLLAKIYKVIRNSLAATKTDTAERSISIVRESIQVFFALSLSLSRRRGVLQVSPIVGSRNETWRGQGISKRSVSWNLPKLSQL